MTVYTRQIAAGQTAAGSTDQLLARVPDDQTWVLRDLVFSDAGGGAGTVILYTVITGSVHIFRGQYVAGGSSRQDLRQALKPGQELRLTATNGPTSYLVTAYVFILP